MVNKKGMCVLIFDVFNVCSLAKESMDKGMSNNYYWEKLTFWKLVGKVNLSEGIFGETCVLALLASAAFHLQNGVSDFF